MKDLMSDNLTEILEAIKWNLHCIYNAKTEKNKEYFKKENERLVADFNEAMKSWIAIL